MQSPVIRHGHQLTMMQQVVRQRFSSLFLGNSIPAENQPTTSHTSWNFSHLLRTHLSDNEQSRSSRLHRNVHAIPRPRHAHSPPPQRQSARNRTVALPRQRKRNQRRRHQDGSSLAVERTRARCRQQRRGSDAGCLAGGEGEGRGSPRARASLRAAPLPSRKTRRDRTVFTSPRLAEAMLTSLRKVFLFA